MQVRAGSGALSAGSVAEAARAVLAAAEPMDKVRAARLAARQWRSGRLAFRFDVQMPERPARPARPELLAPGRMPRRGRGGSERGRIALLHALAHIEFARSTLPSTLRGGSARTSRRTSSVTGSPWALTRRCISRFSTAA
jgi:hypothetical protein